MIKTNITKAADLHEPILISHRNRLPNLCLSRLCTFFKHPLVQKDTGWMVGISRWWLVVCTTWRSVTSGVLQGLSSLTSSSTTWRRWRKALPTDLQMTPKWGGANQMVRSRAGVPFRVTWAGWRNRPTGTHGPGSCAPVPGLLNALFVFTHPSTE